MSPVVLITEINALIRCGCSMAMVWTIIPPIDTPNTAARSTSRWSSNPMPSAAMSDRVYGTSGTVSPWNIAAITARASGRPACLVDRPQSRLS